MHRHVLPLVLLLLTWPALADSTNWPNFRGPNLDGSADAKGLPARWSGTRGILWKAQLPGPSSATPAIWGDRIFLTAADRRTSKLLALCLDARSGKLLWKREHGQNYRRGRNDMTAPSPVTDGKQVIFMFGTGELAAYDLAGGVRWGRQLAQQFGRLSWIFAYGASPLLHGGRLYLQLMRRPSGDELRPFLLALDPATGKQLWRIERPGKAVGESWESYVTPTMHGKGDRQQLVLIGADAVTGHAPSTGRELWRSEYNESRRRNWRVVPTPTSDGERLFLALPRGRWFATIKAGGATDRLDKRALWTARENIPDVCSPLLYRGRLYLVDGVRGRLSCFDPTSGKRLWRARLEGAEVIRSSPTAADGKLYIIDEGGLVFVVRAGDRFEQLGSIPMGGGEDSPSRSSVVIAGGKLFIRTASALYCIGRRTGGHEKPATGKKPEFHE